MDVFTVMHCPTYEVHEFYRNERLRLPVPCRVSRFVGVKPQPTVISNKKQILQYLATPGFCLDFAPQKQVVHFTSLPFTIVFATSGLRSLRSHPPYAKSLSRERRSGESVRCNTETIDLRKTRENCPGCVCVNGSFSFLVRFFFLRL